MRASVPTSTVDNTYENFPEGWYDGSIAGAEERQPSEGWTVITLSLDGITPKEGTNDPGRSKFSGDLTIETDGINLFEVTDFSDSDLPFGIRRSAGLLAGLAEGLGVAERQGGTVDVDLEAVAQALVNGEFAGEGVGFQVTHYSPKSSDKTYDQFNRFGPAS